tara:strand:- start:112 stop:291 length:180 start_codon:yes stop_codon:yes gene_type:complete
VYAVVNIRVNNFVFFIAFSSFLFFFATLHSHKKYHAVYSYSLYFTMKMEEKKEEKKEER